MEFSLEDGRKLKLKAMREQKSKMTPASDSRADKVRHSVYITSDLTHSAPLIMSRMNKLHSKIWIKEINQRQLRGCDERCVQYHEHLVLNNLFISNLLQNQSG